MGPGHQRTCAHPRLGQGTCPEELKTIKRAIEVIKELRLEETETGKWYVEDSDDWDESHFPERFDPPPCFT